MGGGGTQKTTSSTTSNSPAVSALTDKLANGVSGLVTTGSKVYDQPLYTGLSGTTLGGVNALSAAGNNPVYSQNLASTMDEFGAIASGQRMGQNDAVWNTALDNVANNVNSSFNASGRFGGLSNRNNLAGGLAGVELQRIQGNEARQQAAAAALPGLYSASLAPAQTQLAAGSILDADQLAKRQADAALYDAQNNKGWNDYARASSILNGTAQAAGSTTTQTSPKPSIWQSILGAGLGFL